MIDRAMADVCVACREHWSIRLIVDRRMACSFTCVVPLVSWIWEGCRLEFWYGDGELGESD